LSDLEDDDIERDEEPTADEDLRDETEATRIAEALVFASAQPVSEGFIADRLPKAFDVHAIMLRLQEQYAHRGVNLSRSTMPGRSAPPPTCLSSFAAMRTKSASCRAQRSKCLPSLPITSR
jgi:hypothetical protein